MRSNGQVERSFEKYKLQLLSVPVGQQYPQQKSRMYIVVYMASCRNDRGRDLVKKNCPFRNKGEEKLEAERED
jgi:hypothetical protein